MSMWNTYTAQDSLRLDYEDVMSAGWMPSADAKANHFLTPDDLKSLPEVGSYGGGIGCGRPKAYYRTLTVEAAALQKYGADGLSKKRAARDKRLAKKADAVTTANEARLNLPAAAAAAAPLDAVAAAAAGKELTALRKALTKMAKKAQGFQQRSDRPKAWRVELPLITAANFAALAGRPQDPTLTSFVKVGAFHSESLSATAFFACAAADLPRRMFPSRDCGVQVSDSVTLKYKPSDSTLSVSGDAEIYCPALQRQYHGPALQRQYHDMAHHFGAMRGLL